MEMGRFGNLDTSTYPPTPYYKHPESPEREKAVASMLSTAKIFMCNRCHREEGNSGTPGLSPRGGPQGNFLDWCTLEICSWGSPLKVCPMNWSLSTN